MTTLTSTCVLWLSLATPTAHPLAAPQVTSLTNTAVKYVVPNEHYVILKRGEVQAVIVDNAAVDIPELPEHKAGYNGLASITHTERSSNLFVPSYAGLNYEHIHDGTHTVDKERFEPRRFPMQLRKVNEHTVEVYQAPTPNWKLESCGRYEILPDGTIEYTFECIPRADTFANGYMAFFWASYIDAPGNKAIYFRGRKQGEEKSQWIEAITPKHGVASTHPPAWSTLSMDDLRIPDDFTLTLVNHPSDYAYTSPWYYGVSREKLAFVQMFRKRDQIWMAQSPTGGGPNNPAWDFQWFVPNYKVGDAYGFVMRAAYLPFTNQKQVEQATAQHRRALSR